MKASIQFDQKGSATITDVIGDNTTLQSDFSAPPGATLQGTISSCNQPVHIKVRDCRRCLDAPNQFVLRGRFVNLSRLARDVLVGSLADGRD
jgi:hypothetical protein